MKTKAKSKKIPVKCVSCGETFYVFPSRSKSKYCSRECRTRKITVVCGCCGTTFQTFPSRTQTKYCSRKCQHKGRIKDKTKQCINCGKDYRAVNHKVRKFCCVECACDYWKKTRIHKICEYCGKEFVVKKGYTHAKYCSMKCSSNGTKRYGEGVWNWTGGGDRYYGENWVEQSKKARERDGYTCQKCGKHRKYPTLDVHHIRPIRLFDWDWKIANHLDNLVTLCRKCHSQEDKILLYNVGGLPRDKGRFVGINSHKQCNP